MSVHLGYWTAAISEAEATNIGGLFCSVMDSMLQDASASVQDLSYVGERDQSVYAMLNHDEVSCVEKSVMEFIDQQVQRKPHAPAICGWDGDFTYRELGDLTMKLALFLRSIGVREDVFVPYFFNKSACASIAALAIMKAGGAFVGLSSSSPVDRLRVVIDECHASVVLSTQKDKHLFEDMNVHVVVIDQTFIERLSDFGGAAELPLPQSSHAAYLSFTSGSTGKPKGIIVEHGALISSIMAHGTPFGWRSDSRVLQFASYAFDAAVAEVFTTLVFGGCLCIPSEDERLSDLAGALNRLEVTLAFMTPRMAATVAPRQVPKLKTLLVGGEAVSMEDVRPWTVDRDLLVVYGPTETAIFALGTDPLTPTGDTLNLGFARNWNRLWIVDPKDHNRLAPVGTVGELVIEGRTVARGYVNEPEKTAAVFLDGAAWMKDQKLSGKRHRLYKSGDLVRYEPDGSLKYFGRKDTQIKIRGQRVELGEIENAIVHKTLALEHVVVDCIELPNTGQSIVAFMNFAGAASDGSSTDLILPMDGRLRQQLVALEAVLTKSLASYMVPSLFVPICRVPIMAIAGKVDRKGLRAAVLKLTSAELAVYGLSEGVKKEPTTQGQFMLRELWAQVLGRDVRSIGADDSLFRLGGDSIVAIKLAGIARTAGITLTVAQIFKHPELSGMAQEMVIVSPEGLARSSGLLAFALLGPEVDRDSLLTTVTTVHHIPRDDIQDIYPCSPLQEGMVSISSRQAGAYVTRNAYRVPRTMDIERFKASWQAIIDAYAILRTRILPLDQAFIQVVCRPRPFQWRTSPTLAQYLDQDKESPIKPGDPLLRLALVADRSTGENYFIFTAHHAIYDGWTLQNLFATLARVYQSAGATEVREAPYNRFIEYLEKVDRVAATHFWTAQLSGEVASSFPRLPSATYEPQADTFASHRVTDVKHHSVSGITMSTVLRASWALVLARYCDNADGILYGQVLSGRNAPVDDIESILGPTITTVPLKIDIDRTKTVNGFLQQIQDQSSAMIAYEHTGLREIRRISAAKPGATDFKNLFVIHSAAHAAENIDLLGLEEVPANTRNFETYAIVLECTIQRDGVKLDVHHDSAVISSDRMGLMLRHLEQAIRQVIASPHVKLDQIDLFCEQDRAQIMTWNRSPVPPVRDTIVTAFERQVLAYPDRMALESWDGHLTYRALDEMTTTLGHHLRKKYRVGAEVLVPLCFDKSMWTVVAQLSVHKAGGGCVMLNPEHPPARLKTIAAMTNARTALVSPQHRGVFDRMQHPALAIDEVLLKSLRTPPAEEVSVMKPQPENVAFVLFTSGSTGTPKGIVIEHGNACATATYHGQRLGFTPGMRVLQFCHLTFDVSNAEIFFTLMVGGTVCVPSDADRLNDLVGVMNAYKVDWMFMTPTVAELLDPTDVPLLRTLVLGGEASNKALLDRWEKHLNIINSYGPAECTIWTSSALPGPGITAMHIGRGVGCRVWLTEIGDHRRLTPLGCVGEICVEGPIVARHYLKEPTKTAEAFITNPPWLPRERGETRTIYKTGDLGRYAGDGSIIIAGRKDAQVKLHGQRLEMGEIEHHILVQREIETAMVAFPRAGPCQGRLVAVLAFEELEPRSLANAEVVLVDETDRKRSQALVVKVRNAVADLVPPYMVPSVWLALAVVPLTPSGKINRTTIKAWIDGMSDEVFRTNVDVVGDVIDMPTSEMEGIIQQVFSGVLCKPKDTIGVGQSFMALGGDSITAMQVVSKCRAEGLELGVKDILLSKSLAALALTAKRTTGLSVRHAEKYDSPFGLSPIQQMYFSENAGFGDAGPAQHHFNQSLLLSANRALQSDEIFKALDDVVARHSMLRAYFAPSEDGTWVQMVKPLGPRPYHASDHQVVTRRAMDSQIDESHRTMDILHGPLFKADVFDIPAEGQFVSLIAHHLIIDLVSWRIIINDLETVLRGGRLPTDTPLPFAAWNHLQAQQALTLDPAVVLPYEVPPSNMDYWGLGTSASLYCDLKQLSFELDEQTTRLLLSDANLALNTETLDVMLAAVFRSFSRIFDDRAPATIWIESHGREAWDASIHLSETVGWFTSMFPLHVQAKPTMDIVEAVRRVKDARRSVPDNGRPYFAARHFSPAASEIFSGHRGIEVTVNYFGQNQQLGSPDAIFKQHPVNEKANLGDVVRSLCLFDITALINNGRLEMSFNFSRRLAHQDKICQWLQVCQDELTSAARRLSTMIPQYTLSDFPLVKMTYDGLSELMGHRLPQIGISPSNVEDIYPCAPMQEGILLSQAREPGTYEVHQIAEVRSRGSSGPVDLDLMRRSWQRVVNYHGMLRTVFLQNLSDDGTFTHLTMKHYTPDMLCLEYDGPDVVSFLADQPRVDYTQPKPPHRVIFCQCRDRVFFRIDVSHALIDGTSLGMVMHNFVSAYGDALPGEHGPPYSNYIAYLRSQTAGARDAALTYWKRYLENMEACTFPSMLELPDPDGPKVHREAVFDLGREAVFQKFCQKYGVSLANLFQAAWGLTLRAFTGSDETCFGFMTAGRDIPVDGVDEAIGPFINILACRLDLATKTGSELVRQMQTDYLNHLPHQHISLAKIQNSLGMTGVSLFNTSMSLQRLRPQEGLPLLEFQIEDQIDPSEYDVALQITTGRDTVELALTYVSSHMTATQAENVVNTFRSAIHGMVDDPDRKVADLNLFNEHDAAQILRWNGTEVPAAVEDCIHWKVMEIARLRPHAPAIESWDDSFTFAQLDDLSSRLARHLVNLGVGPEVMVPLCFPKSAWTTVSMIAVLKAGGCTVTTNPKDPVSRIESIIADTNAVVTLSAGEFASIVSGTGLKNIVVDRCFVENLPPAPGFSHRATRPNNLAVVMFTSGSTGKPKGVMVQHRSLCTVATEHARAVDLNEQSRVLNYSAYTWDVSTGDNLYTLYNGAVVCVPSDYERMNDIAGSVKRMDVNWIFLTPTVAALCQPDDLPSLRTLLLGGEKIPSSEVARWANINLFNSYGPAECSVWTTSVGHRGNKKQTAGANAGKSYGSRLWVVDVADSNRLAPVGAVGELLIEGPIVTRGYMNNPQATAKAYIETPPTWMRTLGVSTGPDSRLYRTGDLVRYNPDGTLNILGRGDSQIKFNGQRTELSEIESQVRKYLTGCQKLAVDVIAPTVRGGKKILAAFICYEDDLESSLAPTSSASPLTDVRRAMFVELQTNLNRHLPFYMVPQVFILVTRWPLTTSMKVDRKVLRVIGRDLSEEQLVDYSLRTTSNRALETATEKTLQRMWSELLGIADPLTIGADEDFFRLGGDSVVAMKLVSSARSRSMPLVVAEVFRHPTLSAMAAAIDSSTRESELATDTEPFELIGGKSHAGFLLQAASGQCGMAPDSIEDIYPCTPLQEALMAISTMGLTASAYVLQNVLKLPPSLDIDKFKSAWQRLMDTHAIFRTRLISTDAGAYQVVTKGEIDWRSGPSLDRYLEADKRTPMAWGRELVRYAIVGPRHDLHFVWTGHHSIYDGWTTPMILSQVVHFYREEPARQEIPYSRFIAYLSKLDPNASEAFWKSQFSGSAVSYPRVRSTTYVPQTSAKLHHQIDLSRDEESSITLATMVRAAWALITSRYVDADNVAFGIALSGRDAPVAGIEDVMGPTITTVPVEINVDRTKTIQQFLREVQDQSTSMIRHSHTGLQKIRTLSPHAQSAVDFNNLLVIQIDHEGVRSEDRLPLDLEQVTVPRGQVDSYPITLEVTLKQSGVLAETQYDTGVFGTAEMERLLCHFEQVLKQLSASSGTTTVGDIVMITAEDVQQIDRWNGPAPSLVTATIGSLFETQAVLRPNKEAVCGWDGTFTFSELETLSNALAWHLQTLGVSKEVKVPLAFPKSTWIVPAILAVLKCGGTVVMVNPEHPMSRLQGIFKDIQATVLLCHHSLAANFSGQVETVLPIDQQSCTTLSSCTIDMRRPTVSPGDAAFIVYTSGSTGNPKGIILEHQTLITSLLASAAHMKLNHEFRILQFAAYTFDVSIEDIVTALICGGTVCVPSDFERLNSLGSFINDFHVNFAHITPTVASLIRPGDVPSLQVLALGGEAMTQEAVDLWSEHVNLVNSYGPAECSVATSCLPNFSRETISGTIGLATASHLWIVDTESHDRLAPIGAAGELLVEGQNLARGYLNDPDKTARAFITNPAWASCVPGRSRRFYKTGDICRYNPDGTIRYLGRKDTQVKLHGQRIEMGEIEHHLKRAHPSFQQVAVEVVATTSNKEVLAAFVLGDKNENASAEEGFALPMDHAKRSVFLQVQNDLQDVLPSYMIPAIFMPVSQMPQSGSNKLDRKAIREHVASMSQETLAPYFLTSGVAKVPTTKSEIILQKLWSTILKLPQGQIGADSSFFRLGGDSISAMKLVAAAAQEQIYLTVGGIFDNPTLARMATTIDGQQHTRSVEPIKQIAPFGLLPKQEPSTLVKEIAILCQCPASRIVDLYPCTPLQEGMITLSSKQKDAYISRAIYRLPGDLDVERYKAAWDTLFGIHAILRTRIVPNQMHGSLQVVLDVAIDWRSDSSLRSYVQQDQAVGMTYGTPLSRYAIVNETEQSKSTAYFVWTAHHAVYDGYSEGLLFEQAARYYIDGRTPEPVPFVNFIDYITNATNVNESNSYWVAQTSGESPTSFPSLPAPTYSPQVTRSEIRTVTLGRKKGSEYTTSTLLRAAWAMIQGRYSNSHDVVFGLTVSGRNAPVSGITDMMGPTISTVPLRVALHDQDQTVAEYLSAIQNQATAMIPYEHAGIQNIQRLNDKSAALCNFKNLFVFQPLTEGEGSSLGLQRLETDLSGFETFALLVVCSVGQHDKIELALRYDEHVIPSEQARWMMQHFQKAVESLNEEPETVLRSVELLGSEDVAQLTEWSHDVPTGFEGCVHDMVRSQSLKRPNELAISSWDGEFTYGQLDEISARLASSLSVQGVRPGIIVPCCFDKSRWTVVAMLAVLKAGGACRSLDPGHPRPRQEEIIRESESKMMMVGEAHAAAFQGLCEQVFVVKSDTIPAVAATATKTAVHITPRDRAFVVTTSGSTGKPKGVIISHRALCSSIQAHGPALHFESSSRVLQFAAYTFDISIAEMFTTLSFGGTICIPSERDRMDDLAGFMRNRSINWACLTSTVAKLIHPAQVPALKTLVLSGEAPTQSNLDTWGGHVRLLNAYGPSECSVWSSARDNLEKNTSPTDIGRALGCRLWITEYGHSERLTPVGCVGELLIEGPILSDGYLKMAGKTADAFIAAPRWLQKFRPLSSTSRLYKTGDLARFNFDGTVEYLGRRDAQKKLNGQRIEMGEVEFHVKARLQGVQSTAAEIISPYAFNGKKILAAFFAPSEETRDLVPGSDVLLQLDKDEAGRLVGVKNELLGILPKHMVPTMFIPIVRLPTSAAGKLDRRLLAQITNDVSLDQLQRYTLAHVSKLPLSTAEEKLLASFWAQTMKVPLESIGAQDNFFQLGGDSIVAMKLVGSARSRFPAMNVLKIFKYPVLADAARAFSGQSASDPTPRSVERSGRDSARTTGAPEVEVTGHKTDDDFKRNDVSRLSRIMPRDARALVEDICSRYKVQNDNIQHVLETTDIQSMAISGGFTETRWMLNYFFFQSDDPLDLAQLEKACGEVVQTFDALRTIYVLHRSKFLQVILKSMKPTVHFQETDQDLDTATKAIWKTAQSAHLPLEEQLVEFHVIKEKRSQRHRVVMRISHAQYDGVALPFIWQGLKAAYENRRIEEATSYRSFVQGSIDQRTETAYRYWKDLLAGSSMTDIVAHSGPNMRSSHDVVQTIRSVITAGAPTLRSEGITFATVMKAAWALVLSQVAANPDVVFGHTISGRNLDVEGVETVVGACINVVPVRAKIQPGWTALDLLRHIQNQQLENVPYETVGCREIIRRCTDWPKYNYFSSIVQHQNIDTGVGGDDTFSMGANRYTSGFCGSDLDLVDVAILSTPRGSDAEVSMTFASTIIPPTFAKTLLNLLCATAKSFTVKPYELLPPTVKRQPLIPINSSRAMNGKLVEKVTMKEIVDLTEEDQNKLHSLISQKWTQVLTDDDNAKAPLDLQGGSSFFDLGGDLVSVAQLRCALDEAGYRVKMEDLVKNRTIEEQVDLLAPLLST